MEGKTKTSKEDGSRLPGSCRSRQQAESGRNKETKADMEDDIRLLLDCLHFQRHCPSSQRQALSTIATMCAHSSQSRDLFRATGGLSCVLELLFSTTSLPLQQAALYTLGCAAEKNVVNQMKLCEDRLFSFLADLLKPHPPNLPTSGNTALVMSVAYVCGCLMSGNAQGQNAAREKRLLHKLIAVYKCYLPKAGSPKSADSRLESDGKKGLANGSFEVWTSISSALTTANNNPQNDMNQCVCSQLLPAALSLVGGSPLSPDILRPAVTFITSCVAGNGTTQSRLRMVGGLQILVYALKELSTEQARETANRVESIDLAVHIVQSLSAAVFMNDMNTNTLCDCGIIRELLQVLQWEGLDGHAQLSIVMCLSMLTEDRVSSQQELMSSGGLQLLLSILSGGCEEELNKATAFILQCCLPHHQQVINSNGTESSWSCRWLMTEDRLRTQPQTSVITVTAWFSTSSMPDDDEAVMASIARVEKLLSVKDVSRGATTHEDKDMQDLSSASSQSSNPSLTSAHALRHKVSCHKSTTTQECPDILEELDCEKLPTRTTVNNWLMNFDLKSHEVNNSERRSDVNVGGVNGLPSRRNGGKPFITHQNEKNRVDHTTETVPSEGVQGGVMAVPDKQGKPEKPVNIRNNLESEEFVKEHILIKELEKKLEKESRKRKQLEKLVRQKPLAEREKQDKENERVGDKSQFMRCFSKLPQRTTGSGFDSEPVTSRIACNSNKDNIPPKSLPKRSKTLKRNSNLLSVSVTTPVNTAKPSIVRYATTRSDTDKIRCVSNLVSKRDLSEKSSTRQDKQDNSSQVENVVIQHREVLTTKGMKTLSSVPDDGVDTELSRNPIPALSGNNCLSAQQDCVMGKLSEPCTNDIVTRTIPLHCQHSSVYKSRCDSLSCEHQCLACKPRLRCATVNSRNFISLIRFDRFTCSYHKSLIQSFSVASASVSSRPEKLAQQTNTSSDVEQKACIAHGKSEILLHEAPYISSKHHHLVQNSTHLCSSCVRSSAHVPTASAMAQKPYIPQYSTTCANLNGQETLGMVQSSMPQCNVCARATHSEPEMVDSCEAVVNKTLTSCLDSEINSGNVSVVKDDVMDNLECIKSLGNSVHPVTNACCASQTVCQEYHNHSFSDSEQQHQPQLDCGETSTSSNDSYSELVSDYKPGCRSADVHPPPRRQICNDSDESFTTVSEENCSTHSTDPSWTPPSESSQQTSSSRSNSICYDTTVVELGKNQKVPCKDTELVIASKDNLENSSKGNPVAATKSPQRFYPKYNLIAQPKHNRRLGTGASALGDITNFNKASVGGVRRQIRKRQASDSLTVFDYCSPDKKSEPKYRSSATGELHSVVQKKPRVPWTKIEEKNLLSGVARLGHQWRHILTAYEFHHSRDPVSLKDKYRNLRKYIRT